jgi:hypothetical protein
LRLCLSIIPEHSSIAPTGNRKEAKAARGRQTLTESLSANPVSGFVCRDDQADGACLAKDDHLACVLHSREATLAPLLLKQIAAYHAFHDAHLAPDDPTTEGGFGAKQMAQPLFGRMGRRGIVHRASLAHHV